MVHCSPDIARNKEYYGNEDVQEQDDVDGGSGAMQRSAKGMILRHNRSIG
jgi:hypothetical protein